MCIPARRSAAALGAGCDLVVAQGVEAGGHHDGRSELMPLLEACLHELDVPVLAAGGAEDVERVMAAGADGVRVGTRFVATEGSGAHARYREALVAAHAVDAVETDRFSIGCPLCPSSHGVLRSCIDAAERRKGEVVARVGQQEVMAFAVCLPWPTRRASWRPCACTQAAVWERSSRSSPLQG